MLSKAATREKLTGFRTRVTAACSEVESAFVDLAQSGVEMDELYESVTMPTSDAVNLLRAARDSLTQLLVNATETIRGKE